MNIGLIGAIGVDDVGDVIMLEANLKLLKEICSKNGINPEFTIFTFNKELSKKQLETFGVVADLVDCINKDSLSADILSAASFEELIGMHLEQVITDKEYLKKFKECDVFYYIGGGYFNSYWGEKLVSTFILPIALAYQYKKPIFISGVNIGPFDEKHINRWKGTFKNIDTLVFRDRETSAKILEQLGGATGKVVLGCDDILARWYDTDSKTNILSDLNIKPKYAVIQLHHWVEKYSENYIRFYKEFLMFLNKLLDDKKIDKVYYLPFNNYKGVDYECGRRLKAFMDDREDMILIQPLKDYIGMREIISNAEFVIASRYHPVVFGIGEQVPTLAICVNDLYNQKLSGAYDVVDLDKKSNMINVNEFSCDRLTEWYKKIENNEYFHGTNITQKIIEYNEDRQNNIEDFLLKYQR